MWVIIAASHNGMDELVFKLVLGGILMVSSTLAIGQTLTPNELSAVVAEGAPQVGPDTMLRLIDHESKGNMFAIGVNAKPAHKAYYPKNKKEAINNATELLEADHNIDMRSAQINSANFTRLNLNVEDE